MKKFIVAIICTAGLTMSWGQSLKDAQTTLKAGNWSVLRSIDSMTDKINCTGIYKDNYGIQLVADAMYIKIAGGLQSVTLRFDDNPAQSMRLPKEMEKKVGTIIIDGVDHSQALKSSRIRVQALTLVRGLASEDLDVTGIQAAAEHIQSGCPVPALPTSAPPISQSQTNVTPLAVQVVEKPCPDQLLTRLRAAGVTEKQIKIACRSN